MFTRLVGILVLGAFVAGAATAAPVNVDLSGASTGTVVNGVGASFAQTFAGQTVAGTGVSGSPSNPLALQAAGTIDVAAFNPGVSAASNSLLSQPGNAAPLAMLLGTDADSLSWTMGSGDGGSIALDLFASNGSLVNSTSFSNLSGYAVFNLSGLGTFRGVTFRNNTDGSGLRFQNFSYNSVGRVPEPGTLALLGLGLVGLGLSRRRKA